jgi:predicted secreted protein
MRRFLAIIMALMAAGLVLVAGCGGSGPKTYGVSDTSITVGKGQQFIIELASNKTTGFEWGIAKPLDSSIVKRIRSTYTVSSSSNKVGVGGTERWTFEGVGAGTTTIVMTYARSFEKGVPPSQTVTYNVTVK